jgi:hypothetical protein
MDTSGGLAKRDESTNVIAVNELTTENGAG